MITVADIQKGLPDWPAGVIEPWLIEFANDPEMGWPPPEPYRDHRWGRLLGQRPISWWKNVTWTLEKTDCGFDGLTPKAKADVMDIRKEMEGGKPDPTTKRRWDNLQFGWPGARHLRPLLTRRAPVFPVQQPPKVKVTRSG